MAVCPLRDTLAVFGLGQALGGKTAAEGYYLQKFMGFWFGNNNPWGYTVVF